MSDSVKSQAVRGRASCSLPPSSPPPFPPGAFHDRLPRYHGDPLAPGLAQVLYMTFLISMPAFLNIGGLIFIIFFIYAYMGVLAFGEVQRGASLNAHSNYETW